jgi:hypothetical protein
VARPGSADPPELLELDPDGPEFELPLWSLSERLHNEKAKPISTTATMCFITAVSTPKVMGKSTENIGPIVQ